jgi:hypothetical protein
MPTGTMQGLFRFLLQAFKGLGAEIPNEKLEALAVKIYSAMSSAARNYHNLDHVFNFADPPDPIRYLAAVFHDIVYVQVDDGIPPELEEDIRPYLYQVDGEFHLVTPLPEGDPRTACLLSVFGFQPGQKVTYASGLNEFLSALVTVTNLGGWIQDEDLFAIVLCIEATIPFRGPDDLGRGHIEVMAERLNALRGQYTFIGTPEEVDLALKRAVVFSNQDVENFAMQDPAHFLEITFKLLPESNVALRKRGVYTIKDYRLGLQKMQRFLLNLDPTHVFNIYKDTPPPPEYERMVGQTAQNLHTGRKYLQIKLLAMAILEGLAEATGGDAPVSLFMGDLPREGAVIQRMEDYLPDLPIPPQPDEVLLRLLSEGLSELGFDLPYSPTSLFVYKSLSETEQHSLFAIAQELFAGRLSGEAFLEHIPRGVLAPIAAAIAELVFTRREKLLKYAEKL